MSDYIRLFNLFIFCSRLFISSFFVVSRASNEMITLLTTRWFTLIGVGASVVYDELLKCKCNLILLFSFAWIIMNSVSNLIEAVYFFARVINCKLAPSTLHFRFSQLKLLIFDKIENEVQNNFKPAKQINHTFTFWINFDVISKYPPLQKLHRIPETLYSDQITFYMFVLW